MSAAFVSIGAMNPSANLFLIGPMGAGKTTIGKRLAARFGLSFIDLDREIEQATGASVNLIFEVEGELAFRDREFRLLELASARSGILLATGGGAVLREENRQHLRAKGFVLYLQTGVDLQLARLRRDRSRPLLRTADPRARLVSLAGQRNQLYQQCADLTWTSTSLSARASTEGLVKTLREHWHQQLEARHESV